MSYKPRDTNVLEPIKNKFYSDGQGKIINNRDIDNWICEYYNTYSEDLEIIKYEQLVRKVFNFVRTKI